MREKMLKIADRLDARADAIFNNLYRETRGKTLEIPKSQMAGALRIFAEEIRETLEKIAFREWDGHGDMFSVYDFASNCGMMFVDSDGIGYYAKKHPGKYNDTMLVSSLPAVPSRIAGGDVNREYTHVAWYNK